MNKTHAKRAYDHLRTKLISGEFLPGSRILYGPLGKELGISATPVREAIGQLANEGFVELVPQLGAVVRRVSREELIELYEMREALEPYAAARAAERIDTERLDELKQQLDCMDALAASVGKSNGKAIAKQNIQQFEKADLAFHMLIIDATGNRLMGRTVGNQRLLTGIFAAERHRYTVELMASTCEDHRKILKALEQGQPDAARAAMAAHIRNSLEITLAAGQESADRWWEA
jgi:DNA-binding GntR family transcriptional regulator